MDIQLRQNDLELRERELELIVFSYLNASLIATLIL